jgi:hypothetical protein
MQGQPASPARHTYRFTIGEQESAERHPARPELVPSGSVRHGDWAVAGECFGGECFGVGAGVCGARSPAAARFQFLEVARYWARGVTGVGIRCNV